MEDFVLKINNLSIFPSNQPSLKLVDNLSFTLQKGQSLGIVGESGSGKSLTALAIMGLCPKNLKITGEILFQQNGKLLNLNQLPKNEFQKIRGKHISMVFQDPLTALNPSMKCGRQLSEPVIIHQKLKKAEIKEKVTSLLKQVQLTDTARICKSHPFQLSGGQRQRVMIAMAMINQPSVLIADEPTTALDATVQKSIVELIKNLQENYHNSLIFISHDLGLIKNITNKVIVMEKGIMVETGNTEEIFLNPQHSYTKGLISCRPNLSTAYKRLPTLSDFSNQTFDYQNKKTQADISNNTEILKVENLGVTYFQKNIFGPNKYFDVLKSISFSVFEGETLGLVGESGSGKTTIGKTLLQLIRASKGNIYYRGINTAMMDKAGLKKFRSKVQMIFQDPYASLNPRLTAGQAIFEAMKFHGIGKSASERKNTIIDLLKCTGLDENYYHRYPHQMSGGQRQRIVIARALSLNPEFIICDESVSALDVSVQAQVLNLLNDLKERFRLTYIFISHDLAVVKYMSDRIIVLNKGEIAETGPSDIVFENPRNEYTRELIKSIYY